MSAVVTLEGPVSGTFVLARGEGVVIGRSLTVDLPVDDLRVSRRHCRIEHGEKGVTALDLRSANGTYVNGQRVTKALLRPGDQLQVGNSSLRVSVQYGDEDYLERSYTCDLCRRAISLMTFADGDVIQLADRFICPQCRDKQSTPEFSLVELDVVQRLYQEGFEVLEKLSISGVVPIYKARKRSLDQLVAIKALPLSGAVSQKKVSRFVQEAKAQARLRHRNVVAIYDVRSLPDLIYIVMELIEGETLLQMIQRAGARLAVRDALRITYQVGRALAHAHEKGIVHRDVKPSNIMVGADGDAKLIDFGLAKNMHELSLGITSDGETLGTVGYMAPEQVRTARQADHRADIYALGATLFHCLSGRPPFIARSEAQLMEEMERSAPPLELLVGVPLSAVTLVIKLLQRRPEDRYQSPHEVLAAIEGLVTELTGIAANSGNVEFLLKVRDDESDHLLQTWRHSRPPRSTGLLGAFRDAELMEFMQLLEVNRKSGVLAVAGGGVRGALGIAEGRIVRAEVGADRGPRAAFRLLTLPQGDFEFTPGEPPPRECDLKISQVLLEAMRVRDERHARG
ncbi:MAG: protein kinase [Planctomycetes bacterium]|nr:protein kinase [Planctomycetota bacterium]